MEGGAASIGRVQGGIEDALALLAAMEERTLLDALRRLTITAPNALKAYVLGEELAIAVEEYPLLQVNVEEGRITTWEDWRNRLDMAARKVVEGLTREAMALLLDRGEELPSEYRERMRKLLTALRRADAGELASLLRELREMLEGIEPTPGRG